MNVHDVIKRPIVTEKTSLLKENNAYVFAVDRRADKSVIKKSVETLFNVRVKSVRTLIQRGKHKRFGKGTGLTRSWKKAVVTLREGKIELFEGV